MSQMDTLVKIHRAIEGNEGRPVIAKEIGSTGMTAAQLEKFEAEGLIERPKSEPVRKIPGRKGRPAFQYRLTKKAKDRVKRHLAKTEKTQAVPAEVEQEPVVA